MAIFIIYSYIFLTYYLKVNVMSESFTCGKQEWRNSSGYISSPGYPLNYPDSISCTYNITVEPKKRIELFWKSFDVFGYMPNCEGQKSGYVAVYIGCGTSYLVSKFCSSNGAFPHNIYTNDSCLFINFVSNGKSAKGFQAFYKAMPANTSVTTATCDRKKDLGIVQQALIFSPNWPNRYPEEDAPCEWTLQTKSDRVFKLNFLHFCTDAVSRSFCSYRGDTVTVKGQSVNDENNGQVAYCGTWNTFSINTDYYKLDIRFQVLTFLGRPATGFVIGLSSYTVPSESSSPQTLVAVITGTLIGLFVIGCGYLWYKHHHRDRQKVAVSSTISEESTSEKITN